MKGMLLSLALIISALLAILWGCWLVVDMAFDHDVKAANEYCAQYGATPSYTYRTRYICVTPDGRVVGE